MPLKIGTGFHKSASRSSAPGGSPNIAGLTPVHLAKTRDYPDLTLCTCLRDAEKENQEGLPSDLESPRIRNRVYFPM